MRRFLAALLALHLATTPALAQLALQKGPWDQPFGYYINQLILAINAYLYPRATLNQTSYDLRLDFGAPCNGSSDAADTVAFQNFVSTVNAGTAPVRLLIPNGTCDVKVQTYTFTNSVAFEGYTEFGSVLQLSANSNISGSAIIKGLGGKSFTAKNMTFDANHVVSMTSVGTFINLQPGYDFVLDHVRMINGGVVSALPAQFLFVNAAGFNSCFVSNSYFSFDLVQATANEALNLGNTANPSNNCIVDSNTTQNTELVFAQAVDNLVMSNNLVKGVGYGAGLAFGYAGSAFYRVSYFNNVIRDTGNIPDVNNNYVNGIQNYANGAKIVGNITSNTCAGGIYVGGVSYVEGNTVEDPGSCLGGSFRQAAYQVNTVSASSGGGSTFGNNVARNVNTTNGTFGYSDVTLISTTVNLGNNDFASMPSGAYNILGAATYLQPTVLFRSVVPFALTSSGSVGNNGALSGITSLPHAYPSAYYYMEAGQISSGSAAGWYYGVAADANDVTLYNNLWVSGTPTVPPTPTPFVTTGPGAFTRTTGISFNFSVNIPAGMMGIAGGLEVKGSLSNNNSAGAKLFVGSYGTTSPYVFGIMTLTTSLESGFFGGFTVGGGTAQTEYPISNYSTFQPITNNSAKNYGSIDSTSAQLLNFGPRLGVATDTIAIESLIVTFIPGQ